MFEALQEEIYFYQLFINCQLIMNNFPLAPVWKTRLVPANLIWKT
jgi:hypothetical protein